MTARDRNRFRPGGLDSFGEAVGRPGGGSCPGPEKMPVFFGKSGSCEYPGNLQIRLKSIPLARYKNRSDLPGNLLTPEAEIPSFMYRIAHISDLHIPPLPRMTLRQLASKRILGLFSWHKKWKDEHRGAILDALLSRLDSIAPDHICVTGDITFTTHPAEVDQAAAWMGRLGSPDKISLIPGNHDAYVPGAFDYVLDKWSPWMRDDAGTPGFPYIHRRGPVNIIGLSSAVVTPPFTSIGFIGEEQLEKTRRLLESTRHENRVTLLMLHHPPHDNATRRTKALTDRQGLQDLLRQLPVSAVLFGHLHYPVRASLEGPHGPIPVLGAASASALGKRKGAAHFHVIEVEGDDTRASLAIQHYEFDASSGQFQARAREAL